MPKPKKNPRIVTAVVIDPAQRRVEVRMISDVLRNWQAIVGGPIEQVARLPDNHALFADEMGRDHRPLLWWRLAGHPPLYCGHAFIVRLRNHSSGQIFTDATVDVREFASAVEFLTADEARALWPEYQAARREMRDQHAAEFERRTGQKPHVVFIESEFPEDE